MVATTAEESTPPERYAPNGASLRMRICTDSSKVASNMRTASSNEVTSGTVSAKGGVK